MARTGSNVVYGMTRYLMDILAVGLVLFWVGAMAFIGMQGYVDFAIVMLLITILVVIIALRDEFNLF